MKVYVVFGSTGEYSDRSEWPVAVYPVKREAEAHVALADKRARELCVSADGRCDYEALDNFRDRCRKGDLRLISLFGCEYIDYTGVRFWASEVDYYEECNAED